jgi:hypothetical protein
MAQLTQGKRGLIVGVANDPSIDRVFLASASYASG